MSKRRTNANPRHSLAEKNLGIISGRVLYYHRFLPQHIRNSYDPDDMIQDVVMHVIQQSGTIVQEYDGERCVQVMVSSKYDVTRSKDTTWTHHVASNRCRAILSQYGRKRYSAVETVSMTPEVELKVATDNVLERREAKNAVERVIAIGSDAALNLLEAIFCGRAPENLDQRAVKDLQAAAQRCSATLEDFEAVYQSTVA